MTTYLEIKSIHAREILDSRGNPTVETDMAVLNRETASTISGVRRCRREPVPDALRQWNSVTGSPATLAWAYSMPSKM